MWQRRTFHECAVELAAISDGFRSAFCSSESTRSNDLQDYSTRGVEVLRIVSTAIRSEQDYGHMERINTPIGALKKKADKLEISETLQNYKPPYVSLEGYQPLMLRDGLNKIVHTDPYRSSFFANRQTHDLILSGTERSDSWIAILSLIDLCKVLQSLPDRTVVKAR